MATAPPLGRADEPKAEPKPSVLMSTPLGLASGTTTKLIVRGLLLEEASECRVEGSPLVLKILSKGKAPLPANTDPKILGDTQVEIEATAPDDLPPGDVRFTVVTPKGESAAHATCVVAEDKLVPKREPNGGFRDAQPIEPGQVIEGTIEPARNVDVFRLELSAGQHLVAEVLAARYGSALDPLLSLYDARGRLLASDDDSEGRDPRLAFAAPESGRTFWCSSTRSIPADRRIRTSSSPGWAIELSMPVIRLVFPARGPARRTDAAGSSRAGLSRIGAVANGGRSFQRPAAR